jgi:hypothetical protein
MLRNILAVIAGYVAMAIATLISIAILAPIYGVPMGAQSAPAVLPMGYLVLNVLSGFAAAICGGFVAVRIAGRTRPAMFLAALVLVLGIAFAVSERGRHPAPAWYFAAIPLAGVAGIVVGANLRRQPSP